MKTSRASTAAERAVSAARRSSRSGTKNPITAPASDSSAGQVPTDDPVRVQAKAASPGSTAPMIIITALSA